MTLMQELIYRVKIVEAEQGIGVTCDLESGMVVEMLRNNSGDRYQSSRERTQIRNDFANTCKDTGAKR